MYRATAEQGATDLNTPILARLQVGMGAKHFPAIAALGKGVYDGAPTRCKKRPPLLESKAFVRPSAGDMAVAGGVLAR